jgi:diguanylate cyclase (GGDEF)-like protein/PAS domain S-box-containing protein
MNPPTGILQRSTTVDASVVPIPAVDTAAAPSWVERLYFGLVVYVVLCVASIMGDVGGKHVTHYVGLLSDTPACLAATVMAVAAARRARSAVLRRAWRWLAIALALYLGGTLIAVQSWLRDKDPFPGPSDLCFLAFYGAMFVGAVHLIRAVATRVPWTQLILDATILVIGYGAFFWFLVVRPAGGQAEVDSLKQALSQAYAGLDCLVLLMLGMRLLASAAQRRIPVLLMSGFALMFIADIFWSLAKMGGYYAAGELQDVFYLASYVPWAAAARAQLRMPAAALPEVANGPDALSRTLPYVTSLIVFLVLIYLARTDIDGPVAVMTTVVFTLTLLLMVRQGVVLRGEAAIREQRAARIVEDRFESLIANASDVIMIVESDGVLRFVSPACERTFGLRPDEMVGRSLLEIWTGPDCDKLRALLTDIAAAPAGTIGPVEIGIDRGPARRVLESVGSNLIADPAVRGLALNFRDISERKALEHQLRQMAFHDPLTLLANRTLFRDRVQHALALVQSGQLPVAVLFLDLDNFKTINDSLGHDAGDRILGAVAQRIVKNTRTSDTVARLGGDEFAVLVESVASPVEVRSVAETLIEVLRAPFLLDGKEVAIAASVGVAHSNSSASAQSLLSNADIAMYHAKAAGKNRYAIFEPRMQDVLHERLRLEADLTRALAEQEFILEYQPIVDLGTGSLLGVEALVRWRHPSDGVLMPAQFISIAEDCGQIVQLGRWVLLEACRSLVAWRAGVAGGNGLRVAVNVSGRQLQHGDLIRDVSDALAISGLEPENLVVELTESTIMSNTEANLERLQKLKALGIRLALDDFGTGYSSLSYLHRFPIDILKIDRSFVSRLTTSDNGPEVARAVITLGSTLGLDIVAEGIELEQEIASLLELGCVAGQGFFFADARPLQELSDSDFVRRRKELWSTGIGAGNLSAAGRFAALESLRN